MAAIAIRDDPVGLTVWTGASASRDVRPPSCALGRGPRRHRGHRRRPPGPGRLPGLAGAPTYGGARQLQPSDLVALNASATPASAFDANNTLWFPRGSIRLVVYASPPAHDMAFVVQGLVNPTVHVPAGSSVTITAVNLDGGEYHTWALSSTGPPYGSMPMMGPGMMTQTVMLAPSSASGFWSQQVTLTATAGALWYLCAVPGHATGGMYGAFDVG